MMLPLPTAFSLFLSLVLLSVPFLLLGVLISSYLLVFVDEHQLAAKFPQNRVLGAVMGSFLGLLFPVAQYGNVPVTRRLLTHGVPFSVAISFFVASGTINPLTIWLGWHIFPTNLTILSLARFLFTWLMALGVGLIFSFYPRKSPLKPHLQPYAQKESSPFLVSGTTLALSEASTPRHRSGNLLYAFPLPAPDSRSWGVFLENFGRETLEFLLWLILGCAIAALAISYLPLLSPLATDSPPRQIALLMAWGFLVSLGSPFNSGFLLPLLPHLGTASHLAFLLFSSVLDIQQVALMIAAFRLQIIFYLLILTFLFSLLGALIFSKILT